DPKLEGMRIVQLSDLHYSPVVWQRYLIQYIHWVNELEPDMVVVTGDLITGGYRFAHQIATILSHLKPKQGVICTLGNHDYSIYGKAVVGKCPKCGGNVCDTEVGFVCENSQLEAKSCKFKIGKTILEQPIDAVQAAKILKDKKSDVMEKFISKSGKPFPAFLVMDKKGKITFEFPTRDDE
ncbi:MAG: hypothetical protein RL616_2430, partial [Verrucomicrobiota bacterium]